MSFNPRDRSAQSMKSGPSPKNGHLALTSYPEKRVFLQSRYAA